MSRDFAQLYIHGMRRVGYDEGDNARRRSKEQTDFIMDSIPSSLSGLAKGAVLAGECAEK